MPRNRGHNSRKNKDNFYQDMIELKNFLMICEANNLYTGVTITQEYFYYMEQPAGFLKAQINMTHCSMPHEKIIRLFDYGIIDYIIFNRPEETFIFGEEIKLIIGNITISAGSNIFFSSKKLWIDGRASKAWDFHSSTKFS